jgi:hypothetical protein
VQILTKRKWEIKAEKLVQNGEGDEEKIPQNVSRNSDNLLHRT